MTDVTKSANEYSWDDAAQDLALLTRATHSEAASMIEPLKDSPLDPYATLYVLRTIVESTGSIVNPQAIGKVLAQVSRAGIPPKPFMKPGTKVKARRFGREIDAKVTASGGSTFTVVALAEDDYTCWQDMTFDDVTIVAERQESGRTPDLHGTP